MSKSDQDALLRLLQKRRSVAPLAMSGPGPDQDQLRELLNVAARVPDHGKLVPWRFIIFEGEGRAHAGRIIEAAFRADNPGADEARCEIERKRFLLAPVVVAVVSRAAPHVKIPEWEQVLSAGAVCMNMEVAALAMGFAACWLTQWYSYDRRVLEQLGLSAEEKIAGFIHIGHSAVAPEDRVRPVLDQIITRFA